MTASFSRLGSPHGWLASPFTHVLGVGHVRTLPDQYPPAIKLRSRSLWDDFPWCSMIFKEGPHWEWGYSIVMWDYQRMQPVAPQNWLSTWRILQGHLLHCTELQYWNVYNIWWLNVGNYANITIMFMRKHIISKQFGRYSIVFLLRLVTSWFIRIITTYGDYSHL